MEVGFYFKNYYQLVFPEGTIENEDRSTFHKPLSCSFLEAGN